METRNKHNNHKTSTKNIIFRILMLQTLKRKIFVLNKYVGVNEVEHSSRRASSQTRTSRKRLQAPFCMAIVTKISSFSLNLKRIKTFGLPFEWKTQKTMIIYLLSHIFFFCIIYS